jgi:diacylglycerol kinase (ATP)
MKNQPLARRLGFAFAGVVEAFRSEHSFRFHVGAAACVMAALLWFRPAPIWWAVVTLTVVLVLAVELVNTAIEGLADHLHPEQHPSIKVVEDCAAAAVLVAALGALGVAAAFFYELLR